MSDDSRVSVLILDKEYQVACPPDERHELLNRIDGKLNAALPEEH